jgi:galactose oxidase-like protein/glyoxal oxidase-like protein
MRNIKSLSRRSFRRASFALCLFALLVALTPGTRIPASAKKHDVQPAKIVLAATVAAAPLQVGGPEAIGQWSGMEVLSTVPVHISMLPDGRLLYWGRDKHPTDKYDVGGTCQTYTYNYLTGANTTISPSPTTNLFCSGHSLLPDGRLLVTGGHFRDNTRPQQEGIGEDKVNVFDYRTNLWTRLNTLMPRGRWYPSHVTLASGEVVTVSGYYRNPSTLAFGTNDIPDLYTSAGTIRPFTASNTIPVYPYLHLAPNGKVFVAGPGPDPSRYFDPTANGGNGLFTTNVADFIPQHSEGSAVTYDGATGKVLMMGGRQDFQGMIHNETEVIDLSSPSPFWRSVGSLAFGRKYHTATVLPDGKVLVTGGTRCSGTNDIACLKDAQNNNIGAARNPELWSPQTEMWTTMAPSPAYPTIGFPVGIPRVYHSTAVLLPDARVLVGGGGLPAAGGEVVPRVDGTPGTFNCTDSNAPSNINCRVYGHKDYEIFSPPYLFAPGGAAAARPVINSAPQSIVIGRSFNVGKSTMGINSVVLVRLASVTHGTNFDQRRVVLSFTTTSSTSLSVNAPADARACPPGPYMLFTLNAQGVPSVAKIVQVIAPTPTEMGSRVVRGGDGRLNIFYRGAAGDLVYTTQATPGFNGWSAHTSLGGFITTNPVAVTHTDGRIHVFARGASNVLYHQWQLTPGGAWSGWALLGAGVQATSELAVARNLDGRLQVFFKGTDNALKYVVQTTDDANSWGALVNLGGGIVTGPSVEANADGRLEVFVVGLDNALFHIWQTTPGNADAWSGFAGLGGYTNSTQLAMARNTDGWIQVFYRGGSDNALYYVKQSPAGPGGWTPHTSLGGVLTSDPSVVANADGRLEVFVRGTDNGVHHTWQVAPSSSSWSGFNARGGSMTSGPVAARNADGRVAFVIRGANNSLNYNSQNSPGSASWTGYSLIGGSASTF